MFIARQPILDRNLKLYAYELLFRESSDAKYFGNATATAATATVVGNLFESGITDITDGAKAFVNFDYDFILSDAIELIDPNTLVIEVLEYVKVDDILIERLKYLKTKGYRIALDDFVESYATFPLVKVADLIKYDIVETPLSTIESDVKMALSQNKTLLAEKIETEAEFFKAKKMGFHLFQGYFFSKPSIVGKSNSKKSTKTQYARMISELKKPEPSYQMLAEIVETDINLAYRLMRVISKKHNEDLIYSIKKALIYMGFKELERWINILMLQELSDKKPVELLKLSLVRTKFGESIAEHSIYKKQKREVALMGLFSMLDAILDESMEDALSGISLTEDVREALIGKSGELYSILEIMIAHENGDWEKMNKISKKIELNETEITKEYLEALKWTNEIISRS